MTHPSWVALDGMPHGFTELDKVVVHVISLIVFWGCSFILSALWWIMTEVYGSFLIQETDWGGNWVLFWWAECKKKGSQEIPRVIGKFGFGVENEAGQKLREFCQENALFIVNTLFQQQKRRLYTWPSPNGQYRNQTDYILCSQRWISSIPSAKTRLAADCGSDHELLIAKFRLKLRKVGTTTRPFSLVQSLSRVRLFWPHEPQHTRPPCPSPTPGVYPNLGPSSQRCHPTILSSVIPFSSCPQSFSASRSFQMSQFFAWGGQSIGVSASTSVPPMST